MQEALPLKKKLNKAFNKILKKYLWSNILLEKLLASSLQL